MGSGLGLGLGLGLELDVDVEPGLSVDDVEHGTARVAGVGEAAVYGAVVKAQHGAARQERHARWLRADAWVGVITR